MSMSTYYRAQAQRCLALSRACSDRKHEAQLTFMANRYFERAGELEQGAFDQRRIPSPHQPSTAQPRLQDGNAPKRTGLRSVRTESASGSTRILKIAAPRRSLEFHRRNQERRNLHLGVPRAIALTVGTVSIRAATPRDLFVSPLESNSRLDAANLKTFAPTHPTAGLRHHYVGALGCYTASACARLEVLGEVHFEQSREPLSFMPTWKSSGKSW